MVTPISHEELSRLLAQQIAPGEQPLLDGFMASLLPGLINLRDDNGRRTCWCDPNGLWEIFQFLRLAVADGDIRVRVSRQGGESEPALEGTRLLVNLPDTPFIVDAVRSFLKQSGLDLYAMSHTVLFTRREERGELIALTDSPGAGLRREMLLVALVEPIPEDDRLGEMTRSVTTVLGAVKRSVEDFPAMRQRLEQEAAILARVNLHEESSFLRWLLQDNFVFMGLRTLRHQQGQGVVPADGVSLGLFNCRDADHVVDRLMPGLLQEVAEILLTAHHEPLTIDYCRHGRSIIYAAEGVDFFAVRSMESPEGPRDSLLVLGRFSRTALANRASAVPILASQSGKILALSGFEPGSSAYYEFRSLYDRMPLRELFYSQPEVVASQIREILRLQGDTDVRVMARAGRHGHYGAILVAFSHNRYRPGLEEEISRAIGQHMARTVAAVTMAGTNTRVFVVCYVDHDPVTPFLVDNAAMAKTIRGLILTWMDGLREALVHRMPPHAAQRWLSRYGAFLDPLYQGSTPPREAAHDLEVLETLRKGKGFACRVTPLAAGGQHLRLYGRHPFPLSSMMGTLSHLGIVCLHEFSCTLALGAGGTVWISRYEVALPDAALVLPEQAASLLERILAAIDARLLADDPLNRLALLAGLEPLLLSILMALRQYLLQLHPQLSAVAINRALLGHPSLARWLAEGFLHHLAPVAAPPWQEEFEEGLIQVTSLADDQILRQLQHLVAACLRSNVWQNPPPAVLAIKIDPARIPGLAPPHPWREIFVYAPGLEGIHLRGGAVARGGIRHSDRPDDYRREILGLMQTQRVKNAIIVPEGAKGGFVLTDWEGLAADRRREETTRRYRDYIGALLSVTDNRQGGTIHHPGQTATQDGDDPYLVVAADKGTAAFSDLANQIALERGYWLGDAFASGGSRGYNHKALAITARGAWRCIRLHFLEMGRNADQEAITVVAIGDMAGDVFGNGLLASPNLQLIGAFNHQHIFLDPDPDPHVAYRERQRLFQLPHSTWQDYRPEAMSEGGGVFSRQAKSIPLAPRARRRLGLTVAHISGEALIRHLLCLDVDLLYNGGIGTYIKSSQESHLQVGDKSNDPVRVDGRQVRALVIAEGGNLGVTRRGRLEFARPRRELAAGRINSDAVDNSGGVDLSDHEVNLKIFLDDLCRKGVVDARERDPLLTGVAEEVTAAVLADNRQQHLAISHDLERSQRQGEGYLELLDYLVAFAGLDPEVEAIPPREQLAAWIQAGEGLPRPLLAILLGYAKIHVKQALLASDLGDLPYCQRYLQAYFPPSLMARFQKHLGEHSLKREIIAAHLANRVVNQVGMGLFFGKLLPHAGPTDQTMTHIPALIQGYLVADALVDGNVYRQQADQAPLTMANRALALDRLEAVLMHMAADLAGEPWAVLDEDFLTPWRQSVALLAATLQDHLPDLLSQERLSHLVLEHNDWLERGMPEPLANITCGLPLLKDLPAMARLCRQTGLPLARIAALHIRLNDHFDLDWLEERLVRIRNRDLWGRLTVQEGQRQLALSRMRLVKAAVARGGEDCAPLAVCQRFIDHLGEKNSDYLTLLAQARRQEQPELLPLTVLISRLREFT